MVADVIERCVNGMVGAALTASPSSDFEAGGRP